MGSVAACASGRIRRASVLFAAVVGLLTACESDLESPGQLVLSIETDMALPRQIDSIQLEVLVQGRVQASLQYSVGQADRDAALPGTLTLLAGDNPSQPVTVRVAGRKRTMWRTFREAITTVPTDRAATLRMPIQWLCDETADPQSSGADDEFPGSMCGDGNTCRAGTCVPSETPSANLPDYKPEDIFGGSADPDDGQCFDTVACMATGAISEPDADCSIPKPDGDDINVALRVASDGICDTTLTTCFVPLNGENEEGWTLTRQRNRIQLPIAACRKLAEGVVSAIYVSTTCETKSQSIPPCGEWSSVGRRKAVRPDSSISPPPQATLITTLPTSNSLGPCCPLMGDGGDRLYACVCQSKTSASVFAIEPLRRSAQPVRSLTLPEDRGFDSFAASVFEGNLYWNAVTTVERAPLVNGGVPDEPLKIDQGSVYEAASLLVDATSVYLLVTGFTVMDPVKVLQLDRSGLSKLIDTGGNASGLQFDQDSDALYVATAFDTPIEGGARVERRSSVVRLDKLTGARTLVMPEALVITPNDDLGGYSGVQIDGTSAFALFANTPDDDGNVRFEVRRAALGAAVGNGAEPEKLYEMKIEPGRTRLRLLGAVENRAILSRVEYDGTDVRNASVLVVSGADAAPRIVADFIGDAPLDGMPDDAERIYWLNGSGKLYGLPRSALR